MERPVGRSAPAPATTSAAQLCLPPVEPLLRRLRRRRVFDPGLPRIGATASQRWSSPPPHPECPARRSARPAAPLPRLPRACSSPRTERHVADVAGPAMASEPMAARKPQQERARRRRSGLRAEGDIFGRPQVGRERPRGAAQPGPAHWRPGERAQGHARKTRDPETGPTPTGHTNNNCVVINRD